MIEIRNVYKIYEMGGQKVAALNGVDLSIKKGEFVSIVGHSGSGKSTLMNMIGGLDRPTEGNVMVEGRDIGSIKDKEMAKYRNNKVGFVFQSFNLEPTYSAIENVSMPLMFAGVGERKRKKIAAEALELVGLGKRGKHKPTEMSGGERQRVSIARAIVNDPQILLADEPTGNLDSRTGESIMNMLRDLNENKGYTVIMVTHNMEDAQYADRIIKIKDGLVEEEVLNEIHR